MHHSADLQWLLAKKCNQFLVRRGGVRLSRDPFNNTGLATKRHSGFIQDKAVVLKLKGEKQVCATIKDGSCPQNPKKMFTKKVFDVKATGKSISKELRAIRPDLAQTLYRRGKRMTKLVARISSVRAARKAHTAKRVAAKAFKRTATKNKK